MTLAVGGDFFDLGGDGDRACFQPLAGAGDGPAELAWAQEWLADVLTRERVEVTPDVRAEVWAALSNLASMPVRQRTISTLVNLVQDAAVRQALRAYTLAGPHGRLLDADHDTLVDGVGAAGPAARWQAFEMEHLMQGGRSALLATLTYLFRRLERRFDGSLTLLVLDEAWLYLGEGQFAAKIREWLKVLRKRNVAVVFATQSLSDIADSSIAPAVIENCPTRIFLPNAGAGEERARRVYESFGLNARQVQLLQQAAPKRDYYYQGRDGNRLFELGLGELALAFCAAGSPVDQARITRVLAGHGRRRFAAAYLDEVGLGDWAAQVRRLQEEEEGHEQFEFDFWGQDRPRGSLTAMAAGA
jgi:type IV secretory pathway VirB4 component